MRLDLEGWVSSRAGRPWEEFSFIFSSARIMDTIRPMQRTPSESPGHGGRARTFLQKNGGLQKGSGSQTDKCMVSHTHPEE